MGMYFGLTEEENMAYQNSQDTENAMALNVQQSAL